MIRMSTLRNTAVICSGKQVGLLQDIILDEEQKRVEALIVSCGIHGKRLVCRMNISAITDRFILVQTTEKITHISAVKSRLFFRDTLGLLVGRVSDYAIDEINLCISAIEMQTDYSWHKKNNRIWVFDYLKYDGNDLDLTIPASMGSELIMSEEEDEYAYGNHEGNCCWQPVGYYNGCRSDDDASGETHEAGNG